MKLFGATGIQDFLMSAAFMDERMSFWLAHTLPEHQPLGGINRARLFAYEKLAERRAEKNGTTIVEPLSLDEVPD